MDFCSVLHGLQIAEYSPIAHKSSESIKLDFETFKWVYTITPSIVYSIIIIIIILVLLCGKRVGGIYVTKHKD